MYYSGHYILSTRRSGHCNNNNMETRLAQHRSTIQIKEDGKQHKFFAFPPFNNHSRILLAT